MTEPAGPRCLIVDSGLANLGGHNFSYSTSVRQELERSGYRVDVWASRRLPDDLAREHRMERVFRDGAYDYCASAALRDVMPHLRAQARRYEEDVIETLQDDRGRYRFVFAHTVGDFELLAWPELIRRGSVETRLGILLRNTRAFRSMSWIHRTLHPFMALRPCAINRLHRLLGGAFTLFTDSEPLTRDYSAVSRANIVTLPIPIPPEVFEGPVPADRGLRREFPALVSGSRPLLGYLGDARASKGFDLLVTSLPSLMAAAPAATFIIQCPPAASGGEATESTDVATLRRLAGERPDRIIAVPRRLTVEEYGELVQSVDGVLLPYRREGYVEPTSGILAEALALGKPVVAPAATWMAEQLTEAGAGVVFDSGSIESFQRAVLDLLRGWPEYQDQALRNRSRWRSFHSPESLVARLVKQLDPEPASTPETRSREASRAT